MITYLDLAELTSVPAPFDREGWIFELKYDGYRAWASSVDSEPRLLSRRGTDYTDRFPEIAVELLRLPDVILDGELVIVDDNGRPQFDRLTRRSRMTKPISIKHGSRTDPACLFVFDILSIAGDDVRDRPLVDRKGLLKATVNGLKRVRYVDHIEQGVTLFKVADGLGLEGIVAKRADAPYPRGGKSRDWIKIKTAHGRHIDEERAKWNERP